jgi:hypothetical protein
MQSLVPSTRPAPRLQLAPHVRACESGGQVILLDLRRSRYIAIGGRQLSVLAHAVDGWPASDAAVNESVNESDIATLTKPLLAQGLLAPRPIERSTVPSRAAAIEEASASLDAEDAMQDAPVGAARVVRMVRSAAVTATWLRWRSLLSIAGAVAARRARCDTSYQKPDSPQALLAEVAAYEKLRPLLFTTRDRCLHDSLTLVGFLAAAGIFPRWVIGVQTRPFGAHSWVQSGATVLNDHADRVRRFRPILVV